jgi:hypothetical protein
VIFVVSKIAGFERQPRSIAHNKSETPIFAASIEQAALRD